MASIYELTNQYKALEEMLMLSPCEEELQAALAQIEDSIEVKAENYAKVMMNLDADAKAIGEEANRLQARKKAIENNIKRMKEALKMAMQATGKTNFKTELFSFNIQKNGGKAALKLTVPTDELPEELKRVVVEPDNDKIREYIEETGDLSFGYIEERGESLRIR